jgi:hypothetical protein
MANAIWIGLSPIIKLRYVLSIVMINMTSYISIVLCKKMATEKWKRENTVPCPSCHIPVEKTFGCNVGDL